MNFKAYLQSNGYSSTTIKGHLKNVEMLEKWAEQENMELLNLTYQDLLLYMKHLTKRSASKSTIAKYINSIRHYYTHQLKSEAITKNPASNLQIKGVKKKVVYDVLSPIELEQVYHKFTTTPTKSQHQLKDLEYQRDVVMLGLLIYQGVTAQELIKLQSNDIKLRQGIIEIPGGRKSNHRELKLEAVQILEIQEYLSKTREEILQATGKQSEQLFISIGKSQSIHPTLGKFTKTIKTQNPRIQDLQQIRASVIVKWLKTYNLRKAQYMAGHRYVSSTEKYKLNDLRDLQEDINKYHPEI